MTLYVLLNGSYSDEHIVAIYSTCEAAELAATVFPDDAHIEEHELDAGAADMRAGKLPYFVRLRRDTGDTLNIHREESSYRRFCNEVGVDVNSDLYTTVFAENEAEAVKIASERRRIFLANQPPAEIIKENGTPPQGQNQ